MHQHYCQDKLKSLSLYASFLEDCCNKEEQQLRTFCDKDQPQIDKKSCCDNQTILSVDDTAQQSIDVENWASFSFVALPTALPIVGSLPPMLVYPTIDKKILRYYSYKAPPNSYPLHVLFSTFLC
nr:hypothetical protein [Aureispira anguillae]